MKNDVVHGAKTIVQLFGGVSERTLQRWQHRYHTLPVAKMIDGSLLASAAAISQWVEKHSGLRRYCPRCAVQAPDPAQCRPMSWDVPSQKWFCESCHSFWEEPETIVGSSGGPGGPGGAPAATGSGDADESRLR